MPSGLATLLTFGFIVVLFYLDSRTQNEPRWALCLPILWLVITGTRFVSQWMNLGFSMGSDDGTEGSPIDALYFATLIALGISVLIKRQILFKKMFINNIWLTIFFVYCFLSIAWSEFPLIAIKRYIKVLGHPIMALLILTDPAPANAFRTVMKRCGFLITSVCILLLKYFPQYGRAYDPWKGEAYNTGAMLTKNELGGVSMIFGLFFLWSFMAAGSLGDQERRKQESLISALFLCFCLYLLYMAHCSTALATFVIGAGVMIVLGLKVLNVRYFGTYVVAGSLFALGAELLFDVYKNVLDLLGEDPTLTDRTKIWGDCLALVENPLLGTGFESFWLGSRLEILWAKWFWHPNQAHNGYIETYLNLGVIGVFILVGLLFSTFHKISSGLLKNFALAQAQMGLFFAIIFFNYAEAAFKGVAFIWTIFFIIAIDYPVQLVEQTEAQVDKVKIRPKQFRYKRTLEKSVGNSNEK